MASPLAESSDITPVSDKTDKGDLSSSNQTPKDKAEGEIEDYEVFNSQAGVNFRTMGWPHASVIFLKLIFATGVLSIPTAMYQLGVVGGTLSVLGWTTWNTYSAILMGDFRTRHAKCHNIADMAAISGGRLLEELVGLFFILANILSAGSTAIAISIAINSLSYHAACTVWWGFLGCIFIAACASIRKLHQISWLTWIGFFSVFIAVLVVVIVVTIPDRPAAAPQEGPFELGFYAFPSPPPDFATGMVASCTIFVSSAGTGAFVPVIAEMKNPRDYRKAVYSSMSFVIICYVMFSLVVYAYCGKWVASPSLGSAGQTIKMVAYGIALVGLVISGCLYVHVAAKVLFVRLLRNTRHLQDNTVVHWVTWLGTTLSFSAIAFLLAEAIPIFNYLLALVGSLVFGPLTICFPSYLWLFDHQEYYKQDLRRKLSYSFHALFLVLGLFLTIGGTYAMCLQIRMAYASGQIGSAFSCADNSNSV